MKQKGILMISSTSIKGGGPEHMFNLGNSLPKNFRVFFAIPFSLEYGKFLNKKNHIEISQRKIRILDILRLIKFVRVNSIDIVHAHGKGAGLLGRILNIFVRKSLIYTFHGIHNKFYRNYQKIIYLIYENIFGKIDSMKIFVSASEKDYAKKNKFIIDKNKFSIINNSVPNKKLINFKIDQKNLNASINIKNNYPNIITACRLVEQKNIYEILEISELIPKCNFIILGDGPLLEEINSFLKRKNINNVYMLGKKNDIFKYLYASKIYLSASFYEGLSISVLEAMSIGLPIIASRVVGNIDAIEHSKTGFLYDLGDINMAAKYISDILKNEEKFIKISKSSQQRQRKKFSYDLMIENYLKIYESF